MNILTSSIGEQIANGIESGINASIILIIILFIISLAIFALYVAVATIVVKKIWYSDIGGRPGRYR